MIQPHWSLRPGRLFGGWRSTDIPAYTRRRSFDSCCWKSASSSGAWWPGGPRDRSGGRGPPPAWSWPTAGTRRGWGWGYRIPQDSPGPSWCSPASCPRYWRRLTWAEMKRNQFISWFLNGLLSFFLSFLLIASIRIFVMVWSEVMHGTSGDKNVTLWWTS